MLTFLLGLVCVILLSVRQERASAQSVFTTGILTVTYFIGERTGTLGITDRGITYLGASVWLVYLLSFAFMFFASIAIDLEDRPGRPRFWCALSIYACGTVYCAAKLGLLNILMELLRIIRNTKIPRFQDRYWLKLMALTTPYFIVLIFVLMDLVSTFRGDPLKCYVGVYPRAIILIMVWNTIVCTLICLLYLKLFRDSEILKKRTKENKALNQPVQNILIPPGMSKASIIGATVVWIFASTTNFTILLTYPLLKEYICLMLCTIDLTIGIIVADYLSGLTAARIQRNEVASLVAMKIARMDLDSVDEFLVESDNLNIIEAALKRIILILRQYKAYVPVSVLQNVEEIICVPMSGHDVPKSEYKHCELVTLPSPPPVGEVSIVFTDMLSSSLIWAELPDEMRESLAIHNKVIRGCISITRGYEVKTIGDSFMVAFEEPSNSLEFALLVQSELFESTWPDELSQLPVCKRQLPDWNGIRVRIGVHYGPVTIDANDVTGRVDYLGNTVNTAARLEGICLPGAVAASHQVTSVARDFFKRVRIPPFVADKGAVQLRGIRDMISYSLVFPDSLSGRLQSWKIKARPPVLVRKSSLTSSAVSSLKCKSIADHPSFVLRKTQGTLGKLSAKATPSEYYALNDTFSLVSSCLIRTEGITMGIIGNVMSFTWNISKPLENHAVNALRFADMFASYQRRQHNPNKAGYYLRSVIAICTSEVSVASILAGDERFVTVLGDAISLTQAQLTISEINGIFCSYCSLDSCQLRVVLPLLNEIHTLGIVRKHCTVPELIPLYCVSVSV